MLVLSRRVGQQVVIPDFDVTITVVRAKGQKVRVGISAPPHIAVHRHEVWARMRSTSELDNPTLEPENCHG